MGLRELVDEKLPELIKLAEEYGITHLYLVGSVARGESTETSDVDFYVEYKDLWIALGFWGSLDETNLLGVSVDVLYNGHLREDVANSIDSDKVLLWSADGNK